jgi:MDMPI C-terminal domain
LSGSGGRTTGKPEQIPAAVAVDGVAEFLQVTFGSQGPWPHRPARIVFVADEGPSWTLDLTPAGAKLDPPDGGDAVATVHGSASDILLALFGRLPLDRLRIGGDRGVVEELRD